MPILAIVTTFKLQSTDISALLYSTYISKPAVASILLFLQVEKQNPV